MKLAYAPAKNHSRPVKNQKPAPQVTHADPTRISLTGRFEVAMIQRSPTCACGGGCPSCSELATSSIQTKLTISAPGDPLEQEADRVAEQIMRLPSAHNSETPVTVSSERLANRKCSSCEQEPTLQQEEPKLLRAQSGGHALPETERAFFEARTLH